MSRVAAISDDEILAVIHSLSSLSVWEVRQALEGCRVVRRRDRISSAGITVLYVGFLAIQFGFLFVILAASATFFDGMLPPGIDLLAAMVAFCTTFFLIASNPHLARIGKELEADREALRRRLDLLEDTVALLEHHSVSGHSSIEYG